jgi:hypothetical protein
MIGNMFTSHPLIGDISNYTLEELGDKIAELNKKLAFAGRINNPAMIQQIQMILASYRGEYQRKQSELWKKASPDTKGKIDIS